MNLTITIRNGACVFVYDDALLPVLQAGDATVRRASHVEPDDGGGWFADMGPSGGPVLRGFATRAAALAAEREWLAAHCGL